MSRDRAVMLEQNRIIREMAKRSSCVIVGRCGDHILEDVRPFRIFVYAELEHRIAGAWSGARQKKCIRWKK